MPVVAAPIDRHAEPAHAGLVAGARAIARAAAWAVALSVVLLSGCADEAAPGAPRWEVGGVFTEDASQQDLEDLEARLEHWDATLVVMESYPMQYRITVNGGPACDEVRDMLAARAYVRDVGACRAVA